MRAPPVWRPSERTRRRSACASARVCYRHFKTARATQQAFEFPSGWGGKRDGAGRKPKGTRAGVPRARRPTLNGREPLHATLRAAAELGSLRRRDGFRAVRWAIGLATRRQDFRVCHASIQGNHVHLVVEAASAAALSRGMRSFAIATAKELNAAVGGEAGCGPTATTRAR